MKLLTKSLAPVILLAALAAGCGEKEEASAPKPLPETPAATTAAPAAPAEAAPTGAGGYEPTAEERIPGIVIPADAVAAPTVETPAAAPETPAAK